MGDAREKCLMDAALSPVFKQSSALHAVPGSGIRVFTVMQGMAVAIPSCRQEGRPRAVKPSRTHLCGSGG